MLLPFDERSHSQPPAIAPRAPLLLLCPCGQAAVPSIIAHASLFVAGRLRAFRWQWTFSPTTLPTFSLARWAPLSAHLPQGYNAESRG